MLYMFHHVEHSNTGEKSFLWVDIFFIPMNVNFKSDLWTSKWRKKKIEWEAKKNVTREFLSFQINFWRPKFPLVKKILKNIFWLIFSLKISKLIKSLSIEIMLSRGNFSCSRVRCHEFCDATHVVLYILTKFPLPNANTHYMWAAYILWHFHLLTQLIVSRQNEEKWE